MNFSEYENLAIISGVEPQRTILQEKLHKRFLLSNEKSLIVEGKPQKDISVRCYHNITIVSHLPDMMLKEAICKAKHIYCRSGYSTIMDLYVLGVTNATLIPTPGQTEQVYLAEYLQNRGFRYLSQDCV